MITASKVSDILDVNVVIVSYHVPYSIMVYCLMYCDTPYHWQARYFNISQLPKQDIQLPCKPNKSE